MTICVIIDVSVTAAQKYIIDKDTKQQWIHHHIRASSNGNVFPVTGPLCGESTGDRWIPFTKASIAEL